MQMMIIYSRSHGRRDWHAAAASVGVGDTATTHTVQSSRDLYRVDVRSPGGHSLSRRSGWEDTNPSPDDAHKGLLTPIKLNS